jgi:hypothetical protein
MLGEDVKNPSIPLFSGGDQLPLIKGDSLLWQKFLPFGPDRSGFGRLKPPTSSANNFPQGKDFMIKFLPWGRLKSPQYCGVGGGFISNNFQLPPTSSANSFPRGKDFFVSVRSLCLLSWNEGVFLKYRRTWKSLKYR